MGRFFGRQITCDLCGKRFRVAANYVGPKMPCPTCRRPTTATPAHFQWVLISLGAIVALMVVGLVLFVAYADSGR